MEFTYFAIMHRPTGRFMPQSTRRKGFTHDEPEEPNVFPPRLFTERGHAKRALTWWLKGETSVRFVGSLDFGDCDEDWRTEPVPERRAEDMHVVEVTLS